MSSAFDIFGCVRVADFHDLRLNRISMKRCFIIGPIGNSEARSAGDLTRSSKRYSSLLLKLADTTAFSAPTT